ncbi:13091_t:CDS:1, partial [Acaulospora colombiana]
TIGSHPTYPMQLNDSVLNQSTELSTFSSMQVNAQAVSLPYSSMRSTDHTDHTGLDNLSLAAELILSSAISEIPSRATNHGQSVASNAAHGKSQTREEKNEMSKCAGTSSHNLPEDQSLNAKSNVTINGCRSKANAYEKDDNYEPLRKFMYTSESITLHNSGKQGYPNVVHELDGQLASTLVSGTHEDERRSSCFRNGDESDLMETDENVQEEGEDGGNNVEVMSNSTFDNESDNTPSPSPKTRPISPSQVSPVRI